MFLLSCGPKQDISDYYPLAAGDTWRYSTTTVTTQWGAHDTSYFESTLTYRVAVAETAYNQVGEWEIQSLNPDYPEYMGVEHISKWDNAIHSIPSGGLGPFKALLQFPLAVGVSWVAERAAYYIPIVNESAFVTSHEPVTLPAGIFRDVWAIEYKHPGESNPETSLVWYVYGIGVAKFRYTDTRRLSETDTAKVVTTASMVDCRLK